MAKTVLGFEVFLPGQKKPIGYYLEKNCQIDPNNPHDDFSEGMMYFNWKAKKFLAFNWAEEAGGALLNNAQVLHIPSISAGYWSVVKYSMPNLKDRTPELEVFVIMYPSDNLGVVRAIDLYRKMK